MSLGQGKEGYRERKARGGLGVWCGHWRSVKYWQTVVGRSGEGAGRHQREEARRMSLRGQVVGL